MHCILHAWASFGVVKGSSSLDGRTSRLAASTWKWCVGSPRYCAVLCVQYSTGQSGCWWCKGTELVCCSPLATRRGHLAQPSGQSPRPFPNGAFMCGVAYLHTVRSTDSSYVHRTSSSPPPRSSSGASCAGAPHLLLLLSRKPRRASPSSLLAVVIVATQHLNHPSLGRIPRSLGCLGRPSISSKQTFTRRHPTNPRRADPSVAIFGASAGGLGSPATSCEPSILQPATPSPVSRALEHPSHGPRRVATATYIWPPSPAATRQLCRTKFSPAIFHRSTPTGTPLVQYASGLEPAPFRLLVYHISRPLVAFAHNVGRRQVEAVLGEPLHLFPKQKQRPAD